MTTCMYHIEHPDIENCSLCAKEWAETQKRWQSQILHIVVSEIEEFVDK